MKYRGWLPWWAAGSADMQRRGAGVATVTVRAAPVRDVAVGTSTISGKTLTAGGADVSSSITVGGSGSGDLTAPAAVASLVVSFTVPPLSPASWPASSAAAGATGTSTAGVDALPSPTAPLTPLTPTFLNTSSSWAQATCPCLAARLAAVKPAALRQLSSFVPPLYLQCGKFHIIVMTSSSESAWWNQPSAIC